MIITVAGTPGSGKSTLAKMLAQKLGYAHYSIGDLMRQLAKERGVSLLEISRLAETSREIDRALDSKQTALAKGHDNVVIDSRLGWHFIPDSFKVFLICRDDVAAQRIFDAQREHERENTSVQETLDNIHARRASEKERYAKYYSIDPDDERNYDLVLDTSRQTPEETLDVVLKLLA